MNKISPFRSRWKSAAIPSFLSIFSLILFLFKTLKKEGKIEMAQKHCATTFAFNYPCGIFQLEYRAEQY